MPIDMEQMKSDLESMSGLPYVAIKPVYGASKQSPVENKYKLLAWTATPDGTGPLAPKVLKHFGLGMDGRQQAVCPKSFGYNNECPICSWIEAATKSEDPTLIERVKRVKQAERYLQLVIDWSVYQTEKDDAKKRKLGVYDCPPKIHRGIKQDMASQDYDFTVWQDSPLINLLGYSQGAQMPKAIDYKGVAMHQMKPQLVTLNPEEWLPLIPDLAEITKAPSPAKLLELLEGKESSAAEESTPNGDAAEPEPEAQEPEAEAQEEEPAAEPEPEQPAKIKEVVKPKMSLSDLVAAAKKKTGK